MAAVGRVAAPTNHDVVEVLVTGVAVAALACGFVMSRGVRSTELASTRRGRGWLSTFGESTPAIAGGM